MAKVFAQDSWREISNISVFKLDDVEWKNVSKGYVYSDLYGWEVVFPTPVTPTFSNVFSSESYNGSTYEINVQYESYDTESSIVELYSGTTISGTPIQVVTATRDPDFEEDFSAEFSGLSNNTYYSARIISTSSTEDTATYDLVAILINIPSVNITSVSVASANSVTVNWSSSNQNSWRVSIFKSSDNSFIANSGSYVTSSVTSYTFNLGSALQGSTSYYAVVDIFSSTGDYASDSQTFTTPSFAVAFSDITSLVPGYGQIEVNWTNNSFVSYGYLRMYEAIFVPISGWQYTLLQTIYYTSSISATFSGLDSNTLYYFETSPYNSSGELGTIDSAGPIYPLTPTAPDAPFIYGYSTQYFWSTTQLGVNVSWSIPASNGSTITGYVLQYRTSTSDPWSTVYNGSSPSTTYYAFPVSNVSQTIYLRMYTKSSDEGNSGYSYASFSIVNGLTPSLSRTSTSAGYNVTHSNYNSSYSYNGSVTSPGSIVGSVAATSFSVNIGFVYLGVRPTISVNKTTRIITVTCAATWNPTPSVTTTVLSNKINQTTRSGSTSGSPSRTTSYYYQMQYSTDGGSTWTDWSNLSGTSNSTTWTAGPYSSNITNTRRVRCRVTMTTGSYSEARLTSNTVNIP